MTREKVKKILVLVSIAVLVIATPASAKYAEVDGVVWSTTLDGITLDTIYPVGSIYMSVSSTNPANLFGGNWEPWGEGRVPVGVGTYTDSDGTTNNFNVANSSSIAGINGRYLHPLTVDEMPSHNHSASITTTYNEFKADTNGRNWKSDPGGGTSILTTIWPITIGSKGSNQPHNNIQPYITCYMWVRSS